LSQSLGSIFWFRWMQFWGTYQGYRTAGPVTNRLRQIFYYPPGLGARPDPAPRQAELIRYHEKPEG
jgi:hypothetical protein